MSNRSWPVQRNTTLGLYISSITAWLRQTFKPNVSDSRKERAARIVEESVEFAVSLGLSPEEIMRVANAAAVRPPGNVGEEAGDVFICIAVSCGVLNIDLDEEVNRKMLKIDNEQGRNKVYAKWQTKLASGLAFPDGAVDD